MSPIRVSIYLKYSTFRHQIDASTGQQETFRLLHYIVLEPICNNDIDTA